MHRDELIALMQSAECLKECRVVRNLQHVLSEKPSSETLLQAIEHESTTDKSQAAEKQKVRFVACIDPQMPWIKVHPNESASLVRTTSIETICGEEEKRRDDKVTLLRANEKQPAIEQMRREIDELKELVGQLLLGRHKPASRPACK